jgi:D-amino-acid dehydrogenase
MTILVIGCGLAGVTTAYFLGCRGHKVTVIERQAGAGQETSFANGALLHPSMPEPWNAPGCWRALLGSLVHADAPLQLRLPALPALAGWAIGFLRNSRTETFERNSLCNLRLARYSLEVMNSLRQQTNIEYGRVARGSLRIFRERAALDQAVAAANRWLSEGLSFEELSTEETVELEPALEPIASKLAGALHYEADEIGDAYQFCVALAEHARNLGVDFHFGTEVSSLEVREGRVTAVVSARERFVADQYIVAAGSYTGPLLRRLGVRLPVQPAKGYSLTINNYQSRRSLSIPVIDDQLHAAVVPLEGAVRVAGTAEFAGYNLALRPARIRNLLRLLEAVLPQATLDPANARPWCGLRPMSVDGVPIIGRTPISNLSVNTGHGHIGWTMAAGSAQLVADLLSGASPSIDPTPYDPKRFLLRAVCRDA